MNDLLEQLRGVLHAYSIKHLHRETGLSRVTLVRYRDGVSSPTFAAYEKIMKVVIADAVATSARRTARGLNSTDATAS